MNKHKWVTLLGILVLSTCIVVSSPAAELVVAQSVGIDQVPAAVKIAIKQETTGGTIKAILLDETDRKAIYCVVYTRDGVDRGVDFTEDGKKVTSAE